VSTQPDSQRTDFSLDVMGRYVCNGLDEALRSADNTLRPEARPFEVIVIGGGSFGPVLAHTPCHDAAAAIASWCWKAGHSSCQSTCRIPRCWA
jgi:hypothetical protein